MSLTEIARRLSALNGNTPERAGLLTYTIGALYYAYEAKRHGYSNQTAHPHRWQNELDDALDTARRLAASRPPSKPSWVSIVHFNSALMRIDVGFERLVRYVTHSRARDVEALIRAAGRCGMSRYALRRWRTVRESEVNALKHRNPSALVRTRVKYSEMVAALGDLTSLLERTL